MKKYFQSILIFLHFLLFVRVVVFEGVGHYGSLSFFHWSWAGSNAEVLWERNLGSSHKIISKQDKPTEMKDLTLVRDSTVVRDYKNLTWAWGADRKFHPRGHCLASGGCAEWHQIVIPRDRIFYPHRTLMFDPFSGISFDFEYFRKVKRSAMIRNWYNQIPHPALKTKREITKYIKWQQFTKGTCGKPNEQLRQVVI